ncbi:MBOAT family protein [bacterium]|nr:MBOAT family protein [bacterium]
MQFLSQTFIFVFAPLAIVLYWIIPAKYRPLFLTIASYAFYAWWDWRFSILMLITTVVDFTCGKWIAKARFDSESNEQVTADYRASARVWLAFSLVANLGLLAFFKYAGFFVATVNAVSEFLGGGALPVPEIILPLGISFYTFKSITYTLDLYRGRTKPILSFIQYAAFVSLFPELVAGPIDRSRDLAPQLANPPERLTRVNFNLGIAFFAAGLIKKVLIADRIAYYSEPLWGDALNLTPLEAWAAAIGYSLQIFYDFAGYSLMAIGLGFLLGLRLPQNFNSPYRAKDIGDFWRRWHMSLSFWFRDYVFFQIGGLKFDKRWWALFWTMVLCGLWHGAAWTFVIWGAYHGVLLLVHHVLRERKIRWKGGAVGIAGTLFLVIFGWVIFRADTMHTAYQVFLKMFNFQGFATGGTVPLGLIALSVIAMTWAILGPNMFEFAVTKMSPPKRWALAIIGIFAAIAVLIMADSTPFLYAQF